MAEYYLISQLPSLDGISENLPLPITEERFAELCERLLGKKARSALEKLTLSPPKNPEPTGYALIDAWNESERNLRFALGKLRAEKLKEQDVAITAKELAEKYGIVAFQSRIELPDGHWCKGDILDFFNKNKNTIT